MVHKLKTGVFGSLDLSDVSIGVLGAMYVGIFVILTVSWLYCKGMRYTSPPAAWVEFSVSGVSWAFWGVVELQLQLEVASFQLQKCTLQK